MEKEQKKSFLKKIIILGLLSMSWSLIFSTVITGHLWEIHNIRQNLASLRVWTCLNRAYLLFFLLFFIGLHFILPISKMYQWMFNKRWILGIILLIFLTVNRYHGDSISYYSNVIQPGTGTEATMPIIGEVREIRSDEFLVTTPSVLASGYGDNAYGKYNEINRGTKTLNIVYGVYAGYVTLAYCPWKLIFLILPVEYAFSFYWYCPLILCFLVMIELFYIISKKQKMVSVMGAFLVVFSSYYLWWGFPTCLLSTAGTIVCIYYFLNNKYIWKKILLGLGTAICFSNYVINIYPAWQVPLGYMFLVIGIWLLHEQWDKIKALGKKEWLIIIGCVGLIVSFVVAYFGASAEYLEAINSTAYPGKRVDTGSFGLNKLFYYAQAPFYAYNEIANASEAGVFFCLFPIPTIMTSYCWIKEKKKDWLTGGLLLVQIPMLIYLTVGFPELIAKVTLFSYSTTARLADIVGLIQIYFIVILLSHYELSEKLSMGIAGIIAVITAGTSVFVSSVDFPGYMSVIQKVIMFCIIAALCIGIMIKLNCKIKYFFMMVMIGISLYTGIYIRPVMKGLDAFYSKPVASEIKKICEDDKESKWLACGMSPILSSYCVACGASTINSVNYYPNLELWEKLDPEGIYEKIYNRYAHIDLQLTDEETTFEMIQGDFITLNLSYRDIKITGADYLIADSGLELDFNNGFVEIKKIYDEYGLSIYKLNY